jgi:hypothetical protein
MIGKVDEGYFRFVFSGLRWRGEARGLDISNDVGCVKSEVRRWRGERVLQGWCDAKEGIGLAATGAKAPDVMRLLWLG